MSRFCRLDARSPSRASAPPPREGWGCAGQEEGQGNEATRGEYTLPITALHQEMVAIGHQRETVYPDPWAANGTRQEHLEVTVVVLALEDGTPIHPALQDVREHPNGIEARRTRHG